MTTSNLFRVWGGGGARGGYQTAGGVLVNQTNDGVTLDSLWDEISEVLSLYNAKRTSLANLLSYNTTQAADAVSQAVGQAKFEPATEFGVPRGIPDVSYLKLGYSWGDYDMALRCSWLFIRDASAAQVQDRVTRALEADNRLVNGTILQRLFSNVVYTNDFGHGVYGLYNGDMKPPDHLGNKFDATHKHYLASGNTVLDSEDIEIAIHHIREHGYGTTQAARLLILANPDDVAASQITKWRAGVEYETGKTPNFDFIVSSNAPAYLSNESVHGSTPPPDIDGLPVTGSYGSALLIESFFIPAGYVAVVATGGAGADSNVVGFREHVNPAYRGLRHIPGTFQDYPLIESFLARGFGTGVRHRGAAVALQLTASSSYTPPVIAL